MNVYIRRYQNNYQWFTAAPYEVQNHEGDLDALADYYRQHGEVKNWVLIAPALDTAQCDIAFTMKERKHITKAIPFLLEDDLLTEASDLHYVADKPQLDHLSVVALDKTVLSAWLATLASVDIHPTHCLPESKLLLPVSGDWQIFYRHREFIITQDNGQCAAVEFDNFPLCLQLLTSNFSHLPGSIELIAENEADLEEINSVFPEAIKHLIEAKTISYGEMLESRFNQQVKIWNLLKGSFAHTQQWLAVVMPWRWVIISVLLVSSLHVLMTVVQYNQLKNENHRILAEMEVLFRQAIPKGQVVDHRKQLENELNKLQHGGAGGNFMQKMQKIGAVFANHNVQNINMLNYEHDKAEFRFDIILDSYDQLQEVINELKQGGLETEIQNSNAQGEQLRARIRVTG